MSDIEAIAHELDQRAGQVETAGAALARAAAEAIWTSIAADAFRAQVEHRRRACLHAAELLHSAAHDLRRFDADVAAEKARLRRLELAAEHAIATAAAGVASAVHGLTSLAGL